MIVEEAYKEGCTVIERGFKFGEGDFIDDYSIISIPEECNCNKNVGDIICLLLLRNGQFPVGGYSYDDGFDIVEEVL
jgi:hypothetical protein